MEKLEKNSQKIIGEKIKSIRKEKKITQTELANLINKTPSSIQKYEYGLTSIPFEVLEKISKVLGKPLNFFLPEEYENLPKKELKEIFIVDSMQKRYEIFKFLERNYSLKENEKRILSKMITRIIDSLVNSYLNEEND